MLVVGLSQEQAGALAELFGGRHSLLGRPRRACIADLIAFLAQRSENEHLWPQLCTVRSKLAASLLRRCEEPHRGSTGAAGSKHSWSFEHAPDLRCRYGTRGCGRCARRGACATCRPLPTSCRSPSPASAASLCARGGLCLVPALAVALDILLLLPLLSKLPHNIGMPVSDLAVSVDMLAAQAYHLPMHVAWLW